MCQPGGPSGTVFPNNPLGELDGNVKIIIYGFLLLYSFIGVSIVADMFMNAIERVTAKKVRVLVPGTSNRFVTGNVWNETVANLTLMALGSSAPEIMLAINDIIKGKFHAGALGPSTIVGSAAFNLFVIIAVCINAIPVGETRQIKETGVFFITAVFSVLAYVWLLVIVQVTSPDIVTVTEGGLTLLMFPVLVWISYASDAGIFRELFSYLEPQEEEEGIALADGDAEGAEGMMSPRGGMNKGNMGGADGNKYGVGGDDDYERDDEEKGCECTYLVSCCKKSSICIVMFSKWSVRKLCCICIRCKNRRQKKDDDLVEDDEDVLIDDGDLEDSDVLVLDDEGEPIECETGIITFANDSTEVVGDMEEQTYRIKVLRKNGVDGRIACKYRMEHFGATPGYDYVEEEGVVDFRNGVAEAEIEITILPKQVGEKNDQFQIILEDPTNDSIFNPNSDGGEDACLLTVTIINANPANSRLTRAFSFLDRRFNMDEMRQGSAQWYDQISEAYYCCGSAEDQEEAKFLDWVVHIIFFPWQMIYAILTPPPPYMGGWICFNVALAHIGVLTALIGDMAELFGCVADIPDNITAITVVALGTSLPDLFASKAAATQDEWADASIVNVTGSNSVNVFLGIGVPWCMASVYWMVVDAREDELWMSKYADLFIERCPDGCFVVESGDLTFSVVVFTVGALVCLTVIRIRRLYYGGELGGEPGSDFKAYSSALMLLLWVFYISLSVWKSVSGTTDWIKMITALVTCIPIIAACMVFFSIMLQLLKLSKDYIGEEGFFGIAIAVSIVVVRALYFLMFQ